MKFFDKNLLWNALNLQKRELYVKKKAQRYDISKRGHF